MNEFEKALRELNPQQKKAVRQIDGPVLVIAGPGSGKTQLLALRAAEILRRDSTMLPGNILCLTFTDNAAENLRRRLIKYIGQDAYQVAIHTFNSFGQYVINAFPEYFSQWREIKTADELTTFTILEGILAKLPGDHPLARRSQDGSFLAQTQIKNLIGDAKRADLTPKALRQVLKENMAAYEQLLPIIRDCWPDNIRAKGALAGIIKCVEQVSKLEVKPGKLDAVVPIAEVIKSSLQAAAQESAQLPPASRSKPFTAWKNNWLEKNEDNQLIFSGQKQHDKLLAAADVYQAYEDQLAAQDLADFNDQIMRVLAAMRDHDALRYNLQERFQYLMIDEFQDTNRSQLLLARYLTDAPVHEGRPNILVVGDDDQAIYRFQGADIGNVALFEETYRDPVEIPLTTNYRSNPPILKAAQEISRQIDLSLAKTREIDKRLRPTVDKKGQGIVINEFEHEGQHYSYIARQIKELLTSGTPGNEIAVLARERAQLDALLPYLRLAQVPMNYERRENVLEQKHIIDLLSMARLIYSLQTQQLSLANVLFAEVLAQPMWKLEPSQIWQIAAQAYNQRQSWLDVITAQKTGRAKQIADFFISLGFQSSQLPLEQVLDELIGVQAAGTDDEQPSNTSNRSFFSPFKDYYFADELLSGQPAKYLTLLSHLNTLRQHLRNYQVDQSRTLYLQDIISFVDAYNRASSLTMLDRAPHNEDQSAVQLMTVHKAKGLEFNDVFVIGLQNNAWTRSGSRGRFSYPDNLKTIRPSDNQDDDGLRLLFVAMTRARQSLYLNYFLRDARGGASHPYAPLLAITAPVSTPKTKDDSQSLAAEYEQRWINLHGSVDGGELSAYFAEQLAGYQLSATDLNNFLDVSSGGPSYFFNQSLLHFPSADIPAAIYGRLIHAALGRAHSAALAGQTLDPASIIKKFNQEIAAEPLSDADKQYYLKRGQDSLQAYFAKSGDVFSKNQAADVNFRNQNVFLGEARLKGSIDRLDINPKAKTAVISDYKTGGSESRWELTQKSEEYRKIKLHRYRNQLLFYKLLVDNGADWGQRGWQATGAQLRFVEPNDYGRIPGPLELVYNDTELTRFKKLVSAVWQRIQALDFPDVLAYPQTLEGLKAFEEDLLK